MKYSKSLLFLILLFIVGLIPQCKKEKVENNNNILPNDFLASKNYDKLVVEIQSVDGYQPTSGAVNKLKIFLESRLNKPGGITISQNTIASPGVASYSLEKIKEIEKNNRVNNTKGKNLTAYFFFADAGYSGNSGNSKVLGIAYANSSMVIFEETIKEFSGGLGQPSSSALETTVINHEFGHILGLVNNGTSLQASHQDTPNGKHCKVQSCLMYYTAETSDIVANILGSGIPELDANCVNDLRGNGGK